MISNNNNKKTKLKTNSLAQSQGKYLHGSATEQNWQMVSEAKSMHILGSRSQSRKWHEGIQIIQRDRKSMVSCYMDIRVGATWRDWVGIFQPKSKAHLANSVNLRWIFRERWIIKTKISHWEVNLILILIYWFILAEYHISQ